MSDVLTPPEIDRTPFEGVVVRAHGKWFAVQEIGGSRQLLASPRGTLKRVRQATDLVAVGDRVIVTELEDNEARIEEVLPRRSALERPARGSQTVQQIILANPDQALFIFAVHNPEPHRRMLDRFLVLAESQSIPAMIGVSKIDLDRAGDGGVPDSRRLFGDYERSYPVHYFSARTGEGVEALRAAMQDRLTVVAGPSGVGKSSLLNAIIPELDQQVQQVSSATGKGRHTTTSAEIFRIGPGSLIADTPGMRALAMHGVPPEDLDRHYPELRPYLGRCFYADCRHISEPGCPVLEAVAEGAIPLERYESYVALRTGASD
ncbi:MAG: ribosome small subunit-dependent GTPase A [Thermomicrobiales bacterium]|nr:ribosome small subunit-dependent GTPase A [Thermomicrobiales bacterium]